MTIWPMRPTLAIYHLISWTPLGVLEGKIASVRVSWLMKKWLQIKRILHNEITVSLKSGVEHLHYEMSSWQKLKHEDIPSVYMT